MNETEIRKYASLMKELDLTGIEIDEKQGAIRLERERDGIDRSLRLFRETAGEYEAPAPAPAAESGAKGQGFDSVTSPTVGIFYAAPAENAEPYVKVGDVVHKGTVLCIIEVMKLMNEVVAEKEGVVEAVCARDGQMVEYGTELFRMKELSA